MRFAKGAGRKTIEQVELHAFSVACRRTPHKWLSPINQDQHRRWRTGGSCLCLRIWFSPLAFKGNKNLAAVERSIRSSGVAQKNVGKCGQAGVKVLAAAVCRQCLVPGLSTRSRSDVHIPVLTECSPKATAKSQTGLAVIGVFQAQSRAGCAAPSIVEAGSVELDGFASSTTGDAVRSSQSADGGSIAQKVKCKSRAELALSPSFVTHETPCPK